MPPALPHRDVFSLPYWPDLSWFAAWMQAPCPVLDLGENYQKQTARSRCLISGANGPQALVLPVLRKHGSKSPMARVGIDYSQTWPQVHWRALVSAYRSAAFFEYYAPFIEPVYAKETRFASLPDLNLHCLHIAFRLLGADFRTCCVHDYVHCLPAYDKREEARPLYEIPPYYQVFLEKRGFVPGLSILDLLFNEGPNALCIIKEARLP